jgi:hypothetical protein
MTNQIETNQVQNADVQEKEQQKQNNFRLLERRLDLETRARIEAEKKVEELSRRAVPVKQDDDEEDDPEPYIDKKKLKNQLNKFGQNTQQDIEKAVQRGKLEAKEEMKQELWLEKNEDFEQIMSEKNTEKFFVEHKELANTILRMPDTFERQKLVYQTMKRLGIDKPAQKVSDTQQKIDANRTKGSYQPSGMGSSPYVNGGDFSESGKKAAYDKIQALKKNIRL